MNQESVISQYVELWKHMLENENSTPLGAQKLVDSISQSLMDEYFSVKGLSEEDEPDEIEAPGLTIDEYYESEAKSKYSQTELHDKYHLCIPIDNEPDLDIPTPKAPIKFDRNDVRGY